MSLELLDTNVLVHAACRGSPHYQDAAKILDHGLKNRGAFCVAPQNLMEFLSVTTSSRFVDPPLPAEEAHRMAAMLYQSRLLTKIYPKRGTVIRAMREGRQRDVTGARWHDVFLVATMKDSGIHSIVTENARDFSNIHGIAVKSIRNAAVSLTS